jgi:hypothetical protein
MKRIACGIGLFASALVCFGAEQPLHVTVQQLLASPRQFHGKQVDVTGFYRASLEDSSVFASAAAAHRATTHDNCIWLEPDIWDPRTHPRRPQSVADAGKLRGHVVRIIGTFVYRPHREGWGDLWDRAIKDISYFQRAR